MAALLGAVAVVVSGLLAVAPARAQMSASDLMIRIEQLEGQMRRLTGELEQVQYRNQQLEQQLRKMSEDVEFRFQEAGRGGARPAPGGRPGAPEPAPPTAYAPAPQNAPAPYIPPTSDPRPGRRSDAFDPSQNPNAPGTPRVLGQPGRPMDLSTLAGQAAADPSLAPGALPPPPARTPSGGTQAATLAPSSSPRDEFDLAYGFVQRKEWGAAEQGFRDFLARHPGDRLTGDATYWLGETLYQRRAYKDAAEAFLTVSQRHGTASRAPDSLLRLGQSLAALKQKDAACGSFAEIARKHPRASPSLKQAVDREQKRVGC